MKTSYYLAAAVLAAAGVGVSARLPAPEEPKPAAAPTFPSLPPLAIEPPNSPVKLPSVPPPPSVPAPGLPPKPTPLPSVPPPESVSPPKLVPVVPAPQNPGVHTPGSPPTPTPLPTPTPTPLPAAPAATAPSANKILLLADGKLLEGEVGQIGDKVTVRRGALEQAFPKDKVQLVAANKDEVYQHLLAKVPAADAAARMKLARRMLLAGMRDQARREALEVVKLDPANAAAAQMARSLEESLRLFPDNGKPATEVAPAAPPNPGVHTAGSPPTPPATSDIPPVVTEPEPAVPAEAAAAFPTKVQPILANLCADCHSKPAHAGPFKLAATEGFDLRPQAAAQNLRSVAGQIRKEDPAASPLLVKGAAPHGGMKQSAFTGKAAAYAAVEAWVHAAAGTPAPVPAKPAAPAVPLIPPATAAVPASPLPAVPAPTSIPAPPVPPASIPALPTVPPPPSPTNAGPAVDEFDPSVFNQAVHPGTTARPE